MSIFMIINKILGGGLKSLKVSIEWNILKLSKLKRIRVLDKSLKRINFDIEHFFVTPKPIQNEWNQK